ncbi:hypothetical protein Golob_008642 [Gossypium lobatum]|uniref:Uncharacterized protein n=1 Tax=Gossypium lobatum TaxID=34289 RepID=A0A7J8MG30_9ROSI|nr:hypothetical protein [Gossypium lobatum]
MQASLADLSFGMSYESIIDWQIALPKLFLVILTGY